MSSSSSSSSSSSTSAPPSPTTAHNKDSWYPYSNGAHFNGNIAMILIFIFCALICALALNAAIRFFLHMARQEQEQEQQQEATQGADGGDKANQSRNHPSPLHSLPTLVFSSGTKMKLAGCGAAECAICLSEFVEGEGVRILPKCKHGFHVKCIQGWLSSHLSCPTCRTTCLTTTTTTTSPANRTDDDDEERYDVESPPPPPPPPPAASEPQVALLMLQRPGDVRSHPDGAS